MSTGFFGGIIQPLDLFTPMPITIKEIDHLADLARLSLAVKEKAVLQKELAGILAYVSKLQAVDTKKVLPTAQITGLVNVLRADEVKEFPARIFDNGLKVKKVFDDYGK